VTDAGYTTPTPIQAQAIPVVLAGGDVMGGAQTGTGKTASFALPILQKLMRLANTSPSPARHPVRALILAPTRELAIQNEEAIKLYSKHTNLRSTVVYGGVNIKQQTPTLLAGVEVLVATPGRLLDHIEQKTVSLQQVEFFVLDEADRMLDMGFIPDIRRIAKLLPTKRQSLLFSATFSNEIKKLAESLLNNPQIIEVARRNTAAETVTQSVYHCQPLQKRALLEHLVRSRNLWQALCFVKMRSTASRLARALEKSGLAADAIHGDKTQVARIEALEKFKEGKTQVLVATDVAARGLDIEELPIVINYDIPTSPEDYVHRIGRTGRAGASGEAITFVTKEDEEYLRDIEKLINQKIPVVAWDAGELKPERERRPRRAESEERGRHEERSRRDEHGGYDTRRREPQDDTPRPSRREEREAAYAKNPDQPVRNVKKSDHDALPIAAISAHAYLMQAQKNLLKKRAIPALLMKRATDPDEEPMAPPNALEEKHPDVELHLPDVKLPVEPVAHAPVAAAPAEPSHPVGKNEPVARKRKTAIRRKGKR
jgi:superfamily II DNA/RNA helicase